MRVAFFAFGSLVLSLIYCQIGNHVHKLYEMLTVAHMIVALRFKFCYLRVPVAFAAMT